MFFLMFFFPFFLFVFLHLEPVVKLSIFFFAGLACDSSTTASNQWDFVFILGTIFLFANVETS